MSASFDSFDIVGPNGLAHLICLGHLKPVGSFDKVGPFELVGLTCWVI